MSLRYACLRILHAPCISMNSWGHTVARFAPTTACFLNLFRARHFLPTSKRWRVTARRRRGDLPNLLCWFVPFGFGLNLIRLRILSNLEVDSLVWSVVAFLLFARSGEALPSPWASGDVRDTAGGELAAQS